MWKKLIPFIGKTSLDIKNKESTGITILKVSQFKSLNYNYDKDINLYASLCDIRHNKFSNQIITKIITKKVTYCNRFLATNKFSVGRKYIIAIDKKI